MINKFLCVLLACFVSSCVAQKDKYDNQIFKDASCIDVTTPAQMAEFQHRYGNTAFKLVKNEYEEYNYKVIDKKEWDKTISIMDEVIKLGNEMTSVGSGWGYFIKGGFEREKILMIISYKYDQKDKKYHLSVPDKMPDSIRNEMIRAVTNIYTAYEFDQISRHNVEKYIAEINRKQGDEFIHSKATRPKFQFIETPNKWIAEAKDNALNWQKYCRK